ncbi:hemolysin III family protein [Bacteroides sp. 51]|uniref:PAQR family membrane homeostasis protein TrhA n=1 Tax=Bacteroides sp. 51 TaxID=2302938 RepID=UPI0013D1A833|nr:hemolysin III family protein [Bacteroides sp. 51]NDV84480.1 hemolysin III family protein [Bacteroides sp. 51]
MIQNIQNAEPDSNKRYTIREERINTLSHALGIICGIVASYFLLHKAVRNPDPFAVGCVIVYLLGMLSSYITSTWYHGIRPGKTKEVLRTLDHAAIYLHIAATYTPFTLLTMRHSGMWGWGIFIFVWLATIIGLILCFTNLKEHSNLETASFIGMGCAVLIAIKPLMDSLSEMNALPAFWWLIGGGVSYITGALFYSRPRVKYMHCTFHIFCLGGSISHIIAIWLIL